MNQFDTIASFYDPLVKLIFGKAHKESQNIFLNEIPDAAIVLILGGGTGNIIIELINLKPKCKIFYIEASKKMISAARAKCINSNQIQFIHGTEDDIPEQIFDVIITNFYLDLFNNDNLKTVLNKINKCLRVGSKWFVTDFVEGYKWWQPIMLRAMYIFFKMTCKIEANKLPDWQPLFYKLGLLKKRTSFFFQGFIRSELYEKDR